MLTPFLNDSVLQDVKRKVGEKKTFTVISFVTSDPTTRQMQYAMNGKPDAGPPKHDMSMGGQPPQQQPPMQRGPPPDR